MTLEEIEAKKVELRNAINEAETEEKLEELKAEVEAINNEVPEVAEEEKVEEEQPKEEEKETVEIKPEEERSLLKDINNIETRNLSMKGNGKMEEFRNSNEYVEAYADYIKTGEDKEIRALITTGGYATGNSATVEVPDVVYDFVKTAWEKEDLMTRVRTLAIKGNFKVQFEASGDAAAIHTEGQSAVSEESLVLGVVTITPQSIKKWISISDEVVDLRGIEFLRYIYDELTYRIAKKCADTLVGAIAQLPSSLSPNADTGVYDTVSANKVATAPAVDTIATAISNLSDEARNPIIVMNKLTYASFKAVQYANGYGVDVFEGLPVVFNSSLPAYDTASANAVYCIVGDFENGAMATYPNGDDITIKYDEMTDMTKDLVRILGRRYVGLGLVADKSFALITKPASV